MVVSLFICTFVAHISALLAIDIHIKSFEPFALGEPFGVAVFFLFSNYMTISFKSYLIILVLTIVFPLIGKIEPYSGLLVGFLLGINILYIFISIVLYFLFQFWKVNNDIILLIRILLLVGYFIFLFYLLEDQVWISASVILPELFFFKFKKR